MSATSTKHWSPAHSPLQDPCIGHWVTCPICGRPTASTAFFCIHQSTLIAFAPKWWLTATLILTPTAVGLLLSVWNSPFLIYLMLASAILLYLAVAFRSLGGTRKTVVLWSISAFSLIGAQAAFARDNFVTNVGVCGYFLVFGVLILRRALKYVELGHHELAVAISATSSLVTLYSLSLEFVVLLNRFGLGPLWLSSLYADWFFWIVSARVTLIVGSLVILAVKASNEVSLLGGGTESTCSNLFEHMAAQFRQWADSTFAGARIFWQLLVRSMNIVTRLAIRFSIEEVIPAFTMLAAAAVTLWMSIALLAYVTAHGSSALSLGIAVFLIVFLVFMFGYLELIASCANADVDWPPVLRALRPYWYGAITDTRMLGFYISYVIPMTTILLYCSRRAADHFHYETISPGFGIYFFSLTLLFFSALVWGYFRNRASRGRLGLVADVQHRKH